MVCKCIITLVVKGAQGPARPLEPQTTVIISSPKGPKKGVDPGSEGLGSQIEGLGSQIEDPKPQIKDLRSWIGGLDP